MADNESFRKAVQYRLAYPSELKEDAIQTFVDSAIKIYARYRPHIKVADLAGDGSKYEWDLPTDWVVGFSDISQVEYPSGYQDPVMIKKYRWTLYQSPTATKFRMVASIPSATEVVRLTYTVPHTISSEACTIREQDIESVQDLAAGLAATSLSAQMAKTQSNTLDADVVNYLSKIDHYASIGKKYIELFKAHMGIPPGEWVCGYSNIGELDAVFPWGSDFLTHPRSWR